jgi:hypothetical protein
LRGISQTSDSVTCIPNSQLKKAINLIERGKVVEEELTISNKKILLLEQTNKNKDIIISEYSSKDSICQKTISGYKAMVVNLESSLYNAKSINTIDKIRNRRQKLKKWYSLIIGVGIGYLIAK